MTELIDYIPRLWLYLLAGAAAVMLYQMWFWLRYMLVRRKSLLVLPPDTKKAFQVQQRLGMLF